MDSHIQNVVCFETSSILITGLVIALIFALRSPLFPLAYLSTVVRECQRATKDHGTLKGCDKSSPSEHADDPLQLDALVVGAGWAGLWALHKLKLLGLRVKLVESSPDVGGVWYYSRYPGCRNDTEVPLYEYSDPQLWQNWNWTEKFPAQPEIFAYLRWVSEKLNIRGEMIFNTRISSVRWDEKAKLWRIFTKDGQLATAQYFIPCSGYTTVKYVPAFKGINTFKHAYHTSQWPSGLECEQLRVGVIGNAASGIQVIETLSSQASQLTVFQRTPNLATPMRQEQYSEESLTELKKGFPQRFANRLSRNGYDVPPRSRSTFDDNPEERQEFYESLWKRGGLAFWFSNYKDMLTSVEANQEAYNFWRAKVRARVKDVVTADKLAPLKPPHPFGTKRPSLETHYFEIYNQPNVSLVDHTDPIAEITPDGILTASGTFHELDVIIFATGFDFLVGSLLAMDIRGTGGRSLSEKWDVAADGEGVWTHLGIMTAGFPNMFFPMGPQAPSALGLTPQMSEVQGNWIADCVKTMRREGKWQIEPVEEAEREWKKEVKRAAADSLMGQIDSWYLGVNIPQRKKEALCYFGGVDTYCRKVDKCASEGYSGFRMT